MGGCGSPSVALGLRESDEDTRSSLSASSDDWPWGPDSPDEELEPDVQEFMPRWPLFRRPDGTSVKWHSKEWRERVAVWRTERSEGIVRSKAKRRHRRAARADRERYAAALAAKRSEPIFDHDADVWRMPTMDEDVQLPSSSFAGAASMNKLKAAMEGERKFLIAAHTCMIFTHDCNRFF
jgi:hypothetical protein